MMHIHDKVLNALKRQTTMEKAIEFLRTLGFYFREPFTITNLPVHLHHYTFMVRKLGITGNESVRMDSNGKVTRSKSEGIWWDHTMIFGIKMWGKKNSKILIVSGITGEFIKTGSIRTPWKDKADINFRKIVVKLKFPEYLNYEQRRTWRTEYHKQKNNPKRIPSEWYLKILPDIQFI